jgi:hypothetical protein
VGELKVIVFLCASDQYVMLRKTANNGVVAQMGRAEKRTQLRMEMYEK